MSARKSSTRAAGEILTETSTSAMKMVDAATMVLPTTATGSILSVGAPNEAQIKPIGLGNLPGDTTFAAVN